MSESERGIAGAVGWEHTCLAVEDIDRAVTFYRSAFGYQPVFEARGMTDLMRGIVGVPELSCDLVQLRAPLSGHVLELIAVRAVPPAQRDHGPTRPGTAHVAFAVPDLERALAAVRVLGAEPIGSVTTFPDGRSVYCREPSGSFFELNEPLDDTMPQQGKEATVDDR